MLRKACTWLNDLLSDISILKNFWTRDPVLSFHTEPHNYIAGARHHVKLQSTALLPPLKKQKIVCIHAVLAKKLFSQKNKYKCKNKHILIYRTYNLLNVPSSRFDIFYILKLLLIYFWLCWGFISARAFL